MNVFVCAKQVPDTSSNVRLLPDGTLDRSRMRTVTNPDDLAATEAALRLRERFGGTVTVVTMGPPQSEEMLRELLATGADRAILVTGRSLAGSDTYVTARVLAAAIRKAGFGPADVVLCGQQSIDGDTAQVGPELAVRLGIPQITNAAAIEADAEGLTVKSLTDDGYRLVRAEVPCVICCRKELNKPRYMNVSGIFSCYGKPLEVLGLADLDADPDLTEQTVGPAGSPTACLVTFAEKPKRRGTVFEGSERKAAETIAAALRDERILPAAKGGAR